MRVAKSHPLLGWLRLDGHTYSRTLDRSLLERDQVVEVDASHSGHAPGFITWVWAQQLPELCRKDTYRQQVVERCVALRAKSASIGADINRMVGSLLEEQADVDSELEQLQALLDE